MVNLVVTILAAGMGKRMESPLPKVLHRVRGEAMIVRLIKEVIKLSPYKIIVVVGIFYAEIRAAIEEHISMPITYIKQETALGTGHAVLCTLGEIHGSNTNIILNGDVPLLQHSTIQELYLTHMEKKSRLTITSIRLLDPTGNGRIIIDENKSFKEIVEEKDCTDEQKKITLVNCGIYISDSLVLKEFIPKILNNNVNKEYYITDLVKIYRQETLEKINLAILPENKKTEIFNVNTKKQLEELENEINKT